MKRPFEFLGLYKTHPDSCRRPNIPAKRISGNANEEQILIAMQANLDRTEVLANVLNNLYDLYRNEQSENVNEALVFLIEAMDRHIHEKHIQISGR